MALSVCSLSHHFAVRLGPVVSTHCLDVGDEGRRYFHRAHVSVVTAGDLGVIALPEQWADDSSSQCAAVLKCPLFWRSQAGRGCFMGFGKSLCIFNFYLILWSQVSWFQTFGHPWQLFVCPYTSDLKGRNCMWWFGSHHFGQNLSVIGPALEAPRRSSSYWAL